MNESLEKFFIAQEKRDLLWRPQYWVMSMRAVIEVAKAIVELSRAVSKVAVSLREIAAGVRHIR